MEKLEAIPVRKACVWYIYWRRRQHGLY